MLFSIVTTFYNAKPEYIEKIKNSILNQTYTRWEWLITDDFSNLNNCTENVKNLTSIDKRIKYIEQKEKKEIFFNPHKYANGDIVAYIDCDDYIYPKFLEFYYRIFLKFGDVNFLTCESLCEDETQNMNYMGHTFGNYSKFNNISEALGCWDCHNELLLVPHGRAWRNMNIDFTEGIPIDKIIIVNDFMMFTKLEEMGKVLHIPRTLHYYLNRGDSISRYIDTNNDHSTPKNSLGDYIAERRKNKDVKSLFRYFDSIFEESISFHISGVHNEKTCQDMSLITNGEIESYKKELLNELYFDHNLNYNTINETTDYYYIMLKDEEGDLDLLRKSLTNILPKNRKEILVTVIAKQPNDYPFFNSVKDIVSGFGIGYYWTSFRGHYYQIRF